MPALTAPGHNKAFAEALEKYLTELPPDEKQCFLDAHQSIEPDGLLQQLRSFDEADKQSVGRKLAGSAEKFLRVLDQLLRGVAIGIQANPEISSLVVGGARLILDMALKYTEVFTKLSTMISHLNAHLGYLQEVSKHHDLVLVQTCTANIYGELLNFYHHAHQVFKGSDGENRKLGHLRTFGRVQWEPFEAHFGEIDNKIQHHLNVLGPSVQASILSTVKKIDNERSMEADKRLRNLGTEDRKKFLEWIFPLDFDFIQRNNLQKRWPDTGTWLLEKEEFNTWCSSQNSGLIWCNGPPGAGKSVLSSMIVEYIQGKRSTGNTNMGLAFAYFRYDKIDSRKPGQIIAALTKELARQLESYPEEIVEFFNSHYRNARTPSFEEYCEAFFSLATLFSELFIVVDALDECPENPRSTFLEFVTDVTRRLQNAKLFITSRPDSSIHEFFEDLRVPTIYIRAEDTIRDVAKYIRGKLDLLTRSPQDGGRPRTQTLRIQDPAMRDKIYSALVDRTDVMFLWVDLQLDNICRQRSDEDILEALSSLPANLSETYSRILEQIAEQPKSLRELAWRCLMWVLNARERLHLYELRDAVMTQHDCNSSTELQKRREKYTMSAMMDACRNLLVSEDHRWNRSDNYSGWATVRPVHYSLVEFLRRETALKGLEKISPILQNRKFAELELAKTCLTYLRLVYLKDGPAIRFSELQERLAGRSNPFAWYSARYFDEHLVCAGGNDGILNDSLDQMLSMESSALAALAQLRYIKLPNFEGAFMRLDWQVNARTIILTSRLLELPELEKNKKWHHLQLHPFTLHLACVNRSVKQVERLLLLGLNPSSKDHSAGSDLVRGRTALSIALDGNDNKVMDILLSFGADPDETIGDQTILEMACWRGLIHVVEKLLKRGAKGIEGNSTFATALYQSTLACNSDISELLLDKGARFSGEILLAATERGMYELARCLLEKGVDPNGSQYDDNREYDDDQDDDDDEEDDDYHEGDDYQCRSDCTRPLYCAALWGWTRIVQLLLEHKAQVDLKGGPSGTALQAAALGGRLDVVKLLLRYNASVNISDGDFGTALAAVSYSGDRAVTKFLLEAGANVNIPGGRYYSSALAASANSEIDEPCTYSRIGSISGVDFDASVERKGENVTDMLLEAGADVSTQGHDALSAASRKGHIKVFELLLRRGCRPNPSPQCLEDSILHRAVISGNIEIAKALIQNGVDPNEKNRRGATAFHKACSMGHLDVVSLLIDNGADVKSAGPVETRHMLTPDVWKGRIAQRSPLHAVCARDCSSTGELKEKLEILRMLLMHGAEVNAADEEGCTALEIACVAERTDSSAKETVDTLLKAGADIDAPGGNYSGPLEAATVRGHLGVVMLLLKRVQSGAQKDSALQAAVSFGFTEIVVVLLESGANVQASRGESEYSRKGDTPLHIAAFKGYDRVFDLLLTAGASTNAHGFLGTLYEAALVGQARQPYRRGGWGKSSKCFDREER